MIETNPIQPSSTAHRRPPSTAEWCRCKDRSGVFQLLKKVHISCMSERQGSVYKIFSTKLINKMLQLEKPCRAAAPNLRCCLESWDRGILGRCVHASSPSGPLGIALCDKSLLISNFISKSCYDYLTLYFHDCTSSNGFTTRHAYKLTCYPARSVRIHAG